MGNENSCQGKRTQLKCEEFPELCSFIDCAFQEGDRIL